MDIDDFINEVLGITLGITYLLDQQSVESEHIGVLENITYSLEEIGEFLEDSTNSNELIPLSVSYLLDQQSEETELVSVSENLNSFITGDLATSSIDSNELVYTSITYLLDQQSEETEFVNILEDITVDIDDVIGDDDIEEQKKEWMYLYERVTALLEDTVDTHSLVLIPESLSSVSVDTTEAETIAIYLEWLFVEESVVAYLRKPISGGIVAIPESNPNLSIPETPWIDFNDELIRVDETVVHALEAETVLTNETLGILDNVNIAHSIYLTGDIEEDVYLTEELTVQHNQVLEDNVGDTEAITESISIQHNQVLEDNVSDTNVILETLLSDIATFYEESDNETITIDENFVYAHNKAFSLSETQFITEDVNPLKERAYEIEGSSYSEDLYITEDLNFTLEPSFLIPQVIVNLPEFNFVESVFAGNIDDIETKSFTDITTYYKDFIFETIRKESLIPRVYRDNLRQMISIFNGLIYINDEEQNVPVKAIFANGERAVLDLYKSGNLTLPLISVARRNSENSDERRRFDGVLMYDKHWNEETQRAERLITLPPKALNLEYAVTVWTKYNDDIDQISEQIYLMFNPGKDIMTKYAENTKAFIDSTENLSQLTVGDQEDRIIKQVFNIIVETYVPFPRFRVTNTGAIEKFIGDIQVR